MALWWALIVIAFAYVICKFLLMLIPSNVPSIDVDASDGILSLFELIYQTNFNFITEIQFHISHIFFKYFAIFNLY